MDSVRCCCRQISNSEIFSSLSMKPLLLLATFAALLLFPSTSAFGAACPTPPATGSVTWTTPWCDEFNGAAIDTNTWGFDTGNSGFGNGELETYCDPSSNASPCSLATPNASIK